MKFNKSGKRIPNDLQKQEETYIPTRKNGSRQSRRSIWYATSKEMMVKLDMIGQKQVRSLPEIVRLCAISHFGLTDEERQEAEDILEILRTKYNTTEFNDKVMLAVND